MGSRNVFIGVCFTLLSLASFIVSVYAYSVPYTVKHTGKLVAVDMYGKTLKFPNETGGPVTVQQDPHTRHTLDQYLLPDEGLLQTTGALFVHLFRNDVGSLAYTQPAGTTKRYLHFNPYRAAFHVNGQASAHYVEINIPESKIEPYEDGNTPQRLDIITVWPPWGRLMVMPLLTALSVAGTFVSLIAIFPNKKSHHVTTEQRSRPHAAIAAAVFVCGSVAVALICILLYHTMPGFGDEMNYLLQAKIFASGHLSVPQPVFRHSFEVSWMDMYGQDGLIWDFHGIGNSIVLAIGWLVGVPWITIPMVGGLIMAVQYCLALRLFGSVKLSLLHIAFMLTSHYFLTLSGSYMSHAPSLLFISLYFLCIVKTIQDRNDAYVLPAAAAIAFAFNIRPISAVLSALVPATALVFHWYRVRKVRIGYLTGAIVLGLVICSLSYIYTYMLTGTFELAYLVKGPEMGKTISERWKEGWLYRLRNLYQNMNELQNRVHSGTYIFNYMLFVMPLMLWKREPKRMLLASGYAVFALYVVLHSFLHFYGWKWEPRMLYDISFVFFLMTSYGAGRLFAYAKDKRLAPALVLVVGAAFFLYVSTVDLPYRYTVEYANYSVSPPNIRDYIVKHKIHNAIVFFDTEDLYAPYTPANALDFNGDIIYAVAQKNERDNLLIAAHPGRKIFYTIDSLNLIPYSEVITDPTSYGPLK